jgi:hypothetical protein
MKEARRGRRCEMLPCKNGSSNSNAVSSLIEQGPVESEFEAAAEWNRHWTQKKHESHLVRSWNLNLGWLRSRRYCPL